MRNKNSLVGTVRTGVLALAALAGLAACGGGGSGSGLGGGSGNGNGDPNEWTEGVFQPSSRFAAQCVAPRSGTDPATGQLYPDVQGARLDENNWLRSWTNELYLWYDEVPDLNPANYSTPAYFDLLKTPATTASGQPKDNFHFTYPSDEWYALQQSGIELGYGVQWIVLAGAPPRRIVAAYLEPGSAAALAGITRGDEVRMVDGADAVNGNTQAIIDTLNEGLFPTEAGEHTFVLRRLNGAEYPVDLQAAEVAYTPVLVVDTVDTPSGTVGYILFNDHNAASESQLVDAVNYLDGQNINDLVLDLRYNGGGLLYIASQLAYMIAGDVPTAGRTFERIVFNEKHPSTNPVTGDPLTPMPFFDITTTDQPLPSLNLNRVYVLTGQNTCSASESIVNGLRGVDVEVIQIGSTTCGKPYGFYPADNCGTTYFSIQFRGENDQGFGEYADGFSPQNTAGTSGAPVPGCSVGDDFTWELGDPAEARFAAALAYRESGSSSCPQPTGFGTGASMKPGLPLSATDGVMYKSPLRENRILGDF